MQLSVSVAVSVAVAVSVSVSVSILIGAALLLLYPIFQGILLSGIGYQLEDPLASTLCQVPVRYVCMCVFCN